MKDWTGKEYMLERLALARRNAMETAPHGSNHLLEAAMFLAMVAELDALSKEQEESSSPEPEMVAEPERHAASRRRRSSEDD